MIILRCERESDSNYHYAAIWDLKAPISKSELYSDTIDLIYHGQLFGNARGRARRLELSRQYSHGHLAESMIQSSSYCSIEASGKRPEWLQRTPTQGDASMKDKVEVAVEVVMFTLSRKS
jgi:hypothetical protein